MFFLSPEINTTLQNMSITCIVYGVLFFLCVCFFFLDVHYNTMISRKFCIVKRMTFIAFHYLTLLVRGAHINYLYLFLKTTYWEYILQRKISTSEVGPILDLITPSPLINFTQFLCFYIHIFSEI
jgi:hypothetical protein